MGQVFIQIKGSIDPEWSDWLAGMQITPQAGKVTLLSGDLPDQAALFGVLSRLNSLGLALLSVQAQDMHKDNDNG